MAISVEQITPAIGAEISGVDLRNELSAEDKSVILQAFLDHHVLFFREQMLDSAQHLAFARIFGEIAPHPYNPTLEGDLDGVQILEGEGRAQFSQGTFTDQWHSDVTFLPEPYKACILMAQVVPALGSDTLWSSLEAAYELLPSSTQRFIDGLEAVHRWPLGMTFEPEKTEHYVGTVHPVVRVHPETGRKSLFINDMWTTSIVGMDQRESQHLLSLLSDAIKKPETQARMRWKAGSIAVWDNRCTAHYATLDYSGRRRMHRVTVAGDAPIAPSQGEAGKAAAKIAA